MLQLCSVSNYKMTIIIKQPIMKTLKLFFVALTLLVFHPYLLGAQGGQTNKTVVENECKDSVKKQSASAPEMKTIVLPLNGHLNLPVEIDREELIRRYNQMIDKIDSLYHSPGNTVKENKSSSIAIATSKKEKKDE